MTTTAPPKPYVIPITPIENPRYAPKFRADGTQIPSMRDKIRAALAYFKDNDQPAQELVLATAYIAKQFPQYHGNNPGLIAFQCLERGIDPTSLTQIMGHKAWQDEGRMVKHGAEAFAIRQPIVERSESEDESDEMKGCKPVGVFDISMTEPMTEGAVQVLIDSGEPLTSEAPRVTYAPNGAHIAMSLRRHAEGMQKTIDYKLRDMTQKSTFKRNREYEQRVHEGHRLERVQAALLALAESHEHNVPLGILAGLRTKRQLEMLLTYEQIFSQDEHAFAAAGITDANYSAAREQLLEMVGDVGKPSKAQQLQSRLAALALTNIPGWINTPTPLAEQLVSIADIQPGQNVLEPGAGAGHIADAIRQLQPNCTLEVCEISHDLRDILALKDYHLVASDVFQLNEPVYDRIIANFPFERDQDIAMVRHSFDQLLAPGGRLVAIVGWMNHLPDGTPRPSGNSHKSRDFITWLQEHEADVAPLPNGSFTQSLRPTQANATLIVIDK